MPIKISVQASGKILVDGESMDLAQLDGVLQAAKEKNDVVWYHRQSATKEASPEAMHVVKLAIKHKLPISMSSQPDFSDYVDTKGVSHPRVAGAALVIEPRMPEVAARDDIEEVFAEARRLASGAKGSRGLVIVKPDRGHLLLPALSETPALKAMAANMDRLIPAAVKRNIAVIGYSGASGDSLPAIAEVNRFIPFLGLLMGFSYMGHAVWIFEGHASALAAGCRDADALIVDSGMIPFLDANWQAVVSGTMRNVNILIHNRSTFKLALLKREGQATDGLEFSN